MLSSTINFMNFSFYSCLKEIKSKVITKPVNIEINALYALESPEEWKESFFESFEQYEPADLLNFFTHELPKITKTLDINQLQQATGINDLRRHILDNEICLCLPTINTNCQLTTCSKVVNFFSNFVENLVSALNFFDGKEPPSTIYEQNVSIQIYFQFFTIPFVVASILQPLILVAWQVYLITAAILAVAALSLYVYMNWFRRFPTTVPYCENVKEIVSREHPYPIRGLDREMEKLIARLNKGSQTLKKCRPTMLLANSGEGKTTLIYKLQQKIACGDVPADLKNKKIFLLKGGKMMAKSALGIGDKIKTIEAKLVGFEKETIVFIDEIHVFAENNASLELMKDFLRNSKIQFIVATTLIDFNKIMQKDADHSFRRPLSYLRFKPWNQYKTKDRNQLKTILLEAKERLAGHLLFEDQAIDKIIELTSAYLGDQSQPTKALKLLEAVIQKSEAQLTNLTSNKELSGLQSELTELKQAYYQNYPQTNQQNFRRIKELETLILQIKEDNEVIFKKTRFLKQLIGLKNHHKNQLLADVAALRNSCIQNVPPNSELEKRYLFTKFYLLPAMNEMIASLLDKGENELMTLIDAEYIENVFDGHKEIEEKIAQGQFQSDN